MRTESPKTRSLFCTQSRHINLIRRGINIKKHSNIRKFIPDSATKGRGDYKSGSFALVVSTISYSVESLHTMSYSGASLRHRLTGWLGTKTTFIFLELGALHVTGWSKAKTFSSLNSVWEIIDIIDRAFWKSKQSFHKVV